MLAAAGEPGPVLYTLLGVMGGLINVPLAAAYQLYVPADARGNGMAIRNLAEYLMMAAMSALLFGLAGAEVLSAAGQFWLVAVVALVAALVAWVAL